MASKKVSIEIPRAVLHAAKMTAQELKQELAISLYEKGKLSFKVFICDEIIWSASL